MRTLCRLAALALLGLLCASRASAALTYQYEFANASGVAQNVWFVNPGEMTPIQVYLVEVASGGDTPALTTARGALLSAGVRLTLISSVGGTTGTSFNAPHSNVAFNLAFDSTASRNTYDGSGLTGSFSTLGPSGTPLAGLSETIDFLSSGVQATPYVNGTTIEYRILLGTFTLTAGDLGNVSTIQASNLDPNGAYNVSADLSSLYDDSIAENNTPYTATISVVPEPSTPAGLVGLAAAGGFVLLWYRRSRSGLD
jgi:hypothetical protein